VTKKRPALPSLVPGSIVVDTHCHLDMNDYKEDLESVIRRAVVHGVNGIVTIGTDLLSSKRAIEIAQLHSRVYAAIGIHPHDTQKALNSDLEALAFLAENHRDVVVAFGEIGLDYAKMYSAVDSQQSLFKKQLALARELKLPVIIHDRDAHEDCLQTLRSEGPFEAGGVMHCFSGNLEFAKMIIDCNLYVSIPGIVTFKNARDLHEVAATIPLESMLLETDGPFLAPVPYRGKRNEPVYTLYTAAAIAQLRKTTIEEIADHTTVNAGRLFKRDFLDHGHHGLP